MYEPSIQGILHTIQNQQCFKNAKRGLSGGVMQDPLPNNLGFLGGLNVQKTNYRGTTIVGTEGENLGALER